jgi:hypothetical protein
MDSFWAVPEDVRLLPGELDDVSDSSLFCSIDERALSLHHLRARGGDH